MKNCKALADELLAHDVPLTTGGSDNHLLVMNVAQGFGLTGRQAELALREACFTMNRNAIPFDVNGPWYTSGIRMGPAALTTLGMKEEQMRQIGALIVNLLKATQQTGDSRSKVKIDPTVLTQTKGRVADLLHQFPLYPELVID